MDCHDSMKKDEYEITTIGRRKYRFLPFNDDRTGVFFPKKKFLFFDHPDAICSKFRESLAKADVYLGLLPKKDFIVFGESKRDPHSPYGYKRPRYFLDNHFYGTDLVQLLPLLNVTLTKRECDIWLNNFHQFEQEVKKLSLEVGGKERWVLFHGGTGDEKKVVAVSNNREHGRKILVEKYPSLKRTAIVTLLCAKMPFWRPLGGMVKMMRDDKAKGGESGETEGEWVDKKGPKVLEDKVGDWIHGKVSDGYLMVDDLQKGLSLKIWGGSSEDSGGCAQKDESVKKKAAEFPSQTQKHMQVLCVKEEYGEIAYERFTFPHEGVDMAEVVRRRAEKRDGADEGGKHEESAGQSKHSSPHQRKGSSSTDEDNPPVFEVIEMMKPSSSEKNGSEKTELYSSLPAKLLIHVDTCASITIVGSELVESCGVNPISYAAISLPRHFSDYIPETINVHDEGEAFEVADDLMKVFKYVKFNLSIHETEIISSYAEVRGGKKRQEGEERGEEGGEREEGGGEREEEGEKEKQEGWKFRNRVCLGVDVLDKALTIFVGKKIIDSEVQFGHESAMFMFPKETGAEMLRRSGESGDYPVKVNDKLENVYGTLMECIEANKVGMAFSTLNDYDTSMSYLRRFKCARTTFSYKSEERAFGVSCLWPSNFIYSKTIENSKKSDEVGILNYFGSVIDTGGNHMVAVSEEIHIEGLNKMSGIGENEKENTHGISQVKFFIMPEKLTFIEKSPEEDSEERFTIKYRSECNPGSEVILGVPFFESLIMVIIGADIIEERTRDRYAAMYFLTEMPNGLGKVLAEKAGEVKIDNGDDSSQMGSTEDSMHTQKDSGVGEAITTQNRSGKCCKCCRKCCKWCRSLGILLKKCWKKYFCCCCFP